MKLGIYIVFYHFNIFFSCFILSKSVSDIPLRKDNFKTMFRQNVENYIANNEKLSIWEYFKSNIDFFHDNNALSIIEEFKTFLTNHR